MGEIEIDPRGNKAQHDEKDRQENEEPFDMTSLSPSHIYNVREKRVLVNRKHGSSLENFPRIPLPPGQVEAEGEMSNAKVQMSKGKESLRLEVRG